MMLEQTNPKQAQTSCGVRVPQDLKIAARKVLLDHGLTIQAVLRPVVVATLQAIVSGDTEALGDHDCGSRRSDSGS